MYPKLASEWHQQLNGIITPWMVYAHEGKNDGGNVQNGHSYLATVDHRSRGTGCKQCFLKGIKKENK